MGETRFPGRFWLFFLLSAALVAAPCAGRTITLDANGTGDYPTIQAAMDDSNDGDVIVLRPGTYTGPGNRDMDFKGKAITVRSADPDDPNAVAATIIDCNGTAEEAHRGFYFYSGEDANSLLSGFTIMNAYAERGAAIYCVNSSPLIRKCTLIGNSADYAGGAIWSEAHHINDRCAPVLSDCAFHSNSASYGGAACNMHADVTFNRCLFVDNVAHTDGGATNDANNLSVYDECTFRANSAGSGGAMRLINSADAMLNNCVFTGNSATSSAGAVYIVGSTPVITGSTFAFNIALPVVPTKKSWGGAIDNQGMLRKGMPLISHCAFVGNTAKFGGAVRNAYDVLMILNHCRFTNNSAHQQGGALANEGKMILANSVVSGNAAPYGAGLYDLGGYDLRIANCLFYANVAQVDGGGLYYHRTPALPVENCILWENIPQQVYAEIDPPDISYSNVQSGWVGEGNIDADPCFADPGYWDPNGTPGDANDDFWVDGDYHLKSQAGRWDANEGRWAIDEVTSLCIDAGDPMSPIGPEPFPNGGRINMGAYGGTIEASKSYFGGPVCETIVAGDVNGDCIVDFKDFFFVALHWLQDDNQ